MDYRRIILLALITMTGVALWNAWEKDYPRHVSQNSEVDQTQQQSSFGPNTLHTEQTQPSLVKSNKDKKINLNETLNSRGQMIHVTTDVLDVLIDLKGGNLVEAKLIQYPETLQNKDKPVTLLQPVGEYKFIAQSGLMGDKGDASFTNNVVYQSDKNTYSLSSEEKELIVTLQAEENNDITVVKQFTFERGGYLVKTEYQINNNSNNPWNGHLVTQLTRRDNPPPSTSFFQIRSYFGASISTPEKPYQKVSFSEMNKLNQRGQQLKTSPSEGGWVAMQQHYFLAAWIPDPQQQYYSYYQVYPNQTFAIGTEGSLVTVEPQTQHQFKSNIYVGPELTNQLKAAAPHLEMTIDYGWLWFISVILFWIMQKIYDVVGNWGWSIVIVTLLVKLAFFQLTAKSHRSMAKLRDLQPKLMALKQRYGDDKQKMTQATMELYRTEKANPFGGCLPILVQIPVFIALYWVLIESVELRQAPFIGWIHDLSIKDPFYILPGLFCVTMLLQQKLTPQALDPTQAKIMMVLPIVVTVLFINFPAGLLLYMFVNTAASVLQQWYLSKHHIKTSKKKSVKKTIKDVN